jgi:acetyltransferase-like isoleucine patch superfamily enzyme
MNLRRIFKLLAFAAAALMVLPLSALAWLEKRLWSGEALFSTGAQFLAWMPGPVGVYLRGGYYWATLDRCTWEAHVGFGSIFTHRGATLEPRVSTGVYCVIGHASIGAGTRLASRVSIPSGKRQHLGEDGAIADVTRYDTVRIGAGCWIGEGAIVLADVGDRTLVSAGAVVTREMPAGSLVGGNPAVIIKQLETQRA